MTDKRSPDELSRAYADRIFDVGPGEMVGRDLYDHWRKVEQAFLYGHIQVCPECVPTSSAGASGEGGRARAYRAEVGDCSLNWELIEEAHIAGYRTAAAESAATIAKLRDALRDVLPFAKTNGATPGPVLRRAAMALSREALD